MHGQEHVQAVVTLRSGRQVENQVVPPEENLAAQEGRENRSTEERGAEPPAAAPTIVIPPKSFIPKAPFLDRLLATKNGGNLRTFWRCSSKFKLTSHSLMPSSRFRLMPNS